MDICINKMILLGLDTGTKKTGYVLYNPVKRRILSHGDILNQELLELIYNKKLKPDYTIGEMLEGRGNIAGNETYEAILWLGRFVEAVRSPFILAYPRHIRTFHTGRPNSTDKQVKDGLLRGYRDVFRVHGESKSEYAKNTLLQGDEIAAFAVVTYGYEKKLKTS